MSEFLLTYKNLPVFEKPINYTTKVFEIYEKQAIIGEGFII